MTMSNKVSILLLLRNTCTKKVSYSSALQQRRFKSVVPNEISSLQSALTSLNHSGDTSTTDIKYCQHDSANTTPQHVLDQMLLDQRIPNRFKESSSSLPSSSSPVNQVVAAAAKAAAATAAKKVVKREHYQHHQTDNELIWKDWMKTKQQGSMKKKEEQTNTSAVAAKVVKDEQQASELLCTHVTYTDNVTLPLTSKLELQYVPDSSIPTPFPVYRVLDESGHLRTNNLDDSIVSTTDNTASVMKEPTLPLLQDNKELFNKAYETIIRLRTFDEIMMNIQRQGRISFYMSCLGEESIHIGVASALSNQDVILAQYREQGLLLWRGYTLEKMLHQCFSTNQDLGKGRQMPVHYGSYEHQYHTISSPLGTQLPQAVGVAYKLKMENSLLSEEKEKRKRCAVAFFGEGASSTGDFHTACNMSSTLDVPLILICRNNGYAISTSTSEQYRGDGIISRCPGYGIAAIRVDGNDLFAIYNAITLARHYTITNNKPIMIECMTYRQSHHSTSDDSTRYRTQNEINTFIQNGNDPLVRLLNYKRLFNEEGSSCKTKTVDDIHKELYEKERHNIMNLIKEIEIMPKATSLDTMFEDVYYNIPLSLEKQKHLLKEHVETYSDYYNNN